MDSFNRRTGASSFRACLLKVLLGHQTPSVTDQVSAGLRANLCDALAAALDSEAQSFDVGARAIRQPMRTPVTTAAQFSHTASKGILSISRRVKGAAPAAEIPALARSSAAGSVDDRAATAQAVDIQEEADGALANTLG